MQKIILALAVILSTALAHGAVTPLAVSIYPPIQFPPEDFNITGLRLGIMGQHRSVYGIDVGLIGNTTDLDFVGIGIGGLYNYTKGSTTAIAAQLAGLANYNGGKTTVVGLQAALFANINKAESDVVGLQLSLANISDHTDIYGVQAGIYNKADEVYGFQIGLVNFANDLHGIQIGLINFHHKGLVGVAPFLNVGF